jgi:L-2-hydroxyglutarate oxidase LhgO
VAGRRALYPFLDAHKVAYRKCGKLVVATDEGEVPRIEAIATQARANGVEGIVEISGAAARAMEPGLNAVAAVVSPESGVFDSHGYMLALVGEIEDAEGAVVPGTPFEAARPLEGGGFRIHAGGEAPTDLTARLLVTAPGLSAQAVAARIDGFPAAEIPKLHYGKGVYFRLAGRAPFEHLIYPPPIPGALGTHYRKDLGGQAVFGPDLAFVEREDYGVDAGRAAGFYEYVRHFWPGLPDGALTPDYAGIRPKLHGPGEPQPDFRIDGPQAHGLAGLVALFGIESPGLTSSLAIGEEVAGRLATA